MHSAVKIQTVRVAVEFTGGLELLFGGQRKHDILLPVQDSSGKRANVDFLVQYICEHILTEKRSDMFVVANAVRPGILVLINDADWELEGGGDYELRTGDNIMFVSTLHGG